MESETTRDRLIQAAGRVFAERGYQAATVREICAAAEVNIASVNYYFGDKESLYLATVKRARELRAAQFPMPEWPAETPPEERLGGFVITMMRRMISGNSTAWNTQLMFREIIQPTGICGPVVRQYIRPLFDQLMMIVGELLPAGTAERDVRQVAFSIIGQCLYYRVAGEVVRLLTPAEEHRQHYSADALAKQITAFSLAAMSAYPTALKPRDERRPHLVGKRPQGRSPDVEKQRPSAAPVDRESR